MMNAPRVAIIGGGITGLSAAFALYQHTQRSGQKLRCILLEQSPRLGGKIETIREGGFILETGPDSFLTRKPAGINLVRQLGVESELVHSQPSNLGTFVLHHGGLVPLPHGANLGIPSGLNALWSTKLLTPSGKARAALDFVLPARAGSADESLGDLLRRRFGPDLAYHLAEPLLAGIYAGRIDQLSVQATFPQFVRMEREFKSLLRAQMSDERKRKKAGSGTALQNRSAFATLRNGLQTLIERLYDCLRDWADLRTSSTVRQIARSDKGTYLIAVESPFADGLRRELEVDAVIVATPAFTAGPLLSPLAPLTAKLGDVHYASTATVILGYPVQNLPSRFLGAGFVIPFDEDRSITACTWTSSKWPHTTPEEYAVIRCYVGRTGQEDHLAVDDSSLVANVRNELQSILGINASPEFTRVTRWNDAMPQYRVHHLQQLADAETDLAARAPGVLIAGAGYRGLGIPDCIAQGTAAADKVVAYLGSKE